MSSIKTTQIDGDVAVGRNVATGGKLSVAGSATIGHNLRVDGWLEAPNIKDVNKGIFLTLEELTAAYPKPRDGWVAGVGSSTPFTAYIGKDGSWVATGGTIEVALDLSIFNEDVSQLKEDMTSVKEEVSTNAESIATNATQIAAETAARESADAALQTLAEGVVGRIDVSAIDTVPGSVADALAMAKDMMHSRWTLTYRDVLNVGVVDIFSDNMGHVLTEVLTTHYTMNSDGVLDFTGHDDGAVTRYWRTYNISSPYLKNEKGTWSDWAEDIPNTVQTQLEETEEAAATAQTAADKAQEGVDALTAMKGAAGGLAELDADLKVPLANMPDGAFEVLEFAGTVENVTALEQSAIQYAGIAFDTVACCFYAYVVSGSGLLGKRTYYKSWGNWQHYKASADGAPYTGKIYVDTTANTVYRWNGTKLVALGDKQVTLTQEEYDALVEAGVVDADTIYNVVEED